MKEILHKITSMSMALIVLLSTMSFSVDMHYCGDHLVDFSMFDKVDTCLMKSEKSETSGSCDMTVMESEMNCCSDIEVTIEGQDDLKISFDQLSFDQQQFVFSFTYSCISLFEGADENSSLFKNYVPPPLLHDVQVLHQTFLI